MTPFSSAGWVEGFSPAKRLVEGFNLRPTVVVDSAHNGPVFQTSRLSFQFHAHANPINLLKASLAWSGTTALPNPLRRSTLRGSPSTTRPTLGSTSHQPGLKDSSHACPRFGKETVSFVGFRLGLREALPNELPESVDRRPRLAFPFPVPS